MILAILMALQAGGVDHQTPVDLGGRIVMVQNRKDADKPACTVVVDGQKVPTYGHGDIDAYACNGLAAAGRLAPRGSTERIGLIYDVSGSRTVDFRTALVIERVQGRWRIEPDSIGKHDSEPYAQSIAKLRRWEGSAKGPVKRR